MATSRPAIHAFDRIAPAVRVASLRRWRAAHCDPGDDGLDVPPRDDRVGESRHLSERQSGHMPARELRTSGEKIIKVAAPAGWIFARPVAFRLGRVEDRLDPAPEPRRCLGLRGSDRLQHLEHVFGPDRIHGLPVQRRRILSDRHPPLVRVFRVAPRRRHCLYVSLGEIFEGRHDMNAAPPSRKRIAPFRKFTTRLCGQLPGSS